MSKISRKSVRERDRGVIELCGNQRLTLEDMSFICPSVLIISHEVDPEQYKPNIPFGKTVQASLVD